MCKNIRWKIIINIKINGKIKCNKKKTFKVKTEIKKFLQIHINNISPKKGIIINKLVITVQAQKLICDQIKTYPKKDSAIKNNKIKIPRFHTSFKLNLKWNNPFKKWKNKIIKKNLTKFIWIIRKIQPKLNSNIKNSIELKEDKLFLNPKIINNPLKLWIIKINPNKLPKFQKILRFFLLFK